jgi:hypothetical protein
MPLEFTLRELSKASHSSSSERVLEFVLDKCAMMIEVFQLALPLLLKISELRNATEERLLAERSNLQLLINSPQNLALKEKLENLRVFNRSPHDHPELRSLQEVRGGFERELLEILRYIELGLIGREHFEYIPNYAYDTVQQINDTVNQLQKIKATATARLGGKEALLNSRANIILRNSPWFSGSFYLTCFIVIITLVATAERVVDAWSFPLILAAGVVMTVLIGALQLKNDERLSEEGFIMLVQLSYRSLFRFFSRSSTPK